MTSDSEEQIHVSETEAPSPPAPTIETNMTENINLKEQLKYLVELQLVDSEVYDLETQKQAFPEKIKTMDALLDEKTAGLKNAEENLKKLQVSKNEKENDMRSKEEKIAKYQADLYKIKNNNEYKALQQEIDNIKADVSLIEEALIQLFDDIESASVKVKDEKKIFEAEKAKIDSEKSLINRQEAEIANELKKLLEKVSETQGRVDGTLLKLYKKILEHRGRTALARLEGEFCGGCNMHLRPQVINSIRLRKDIVQCDNCARILYAEDE